MRTKILISFIALSILTNRSFSQEKNDYVVLLNNDTIVVQIKKITHSKIVAFTEKEEKVTYTPKNILAYKMDNRIGATGKVCFMVIGFKKWHFLDVIVNGKASLCSLTGSQKSIAGKDQYFSTTIYFYRKKGEERGKYHKFVSWGKVDKFLSDCPAYVKQLNSAEPITKLNDEFLFYNEHCQ